jgi:hypothetical protein
LPERAGIRSHYETTGEPLRSVAERFDVPFSTLGKRAVREKWQRSVPPNGNNDGNKTAVFPEIGNKIGNKHGNRPGLFPKNGNKDGNKTAVFPEIGNKIGNKHRNSEVLFPKNGNSDGNKTAVFPEIRNKIGNSEALFPSNNPLAAKNGSAGNDPAAKSGSKNGSNTELAAKNGSAWNDPAAKSGSKNGSNTELAAKNGSAWNDPAAKSGSKNGSSFDIPADINEWDSLTDQRFALITSRRVRRFVLWRSGSPCTSPRFSRKRHATNGSKPATLLPLEWKQMEASHSLLPFRLEADRKQMEAKQWLLPF